MPVAYLTGVYVKIVHKNLSGVSNIADQGRIILLLPLHPLNTVLIPLPLSFFLPIRGGQVRKPRVQLDWLDIVLTG